MNLEQIFEEIERNKDLPVLVEGPNDKRALERLGFTNVIRLQGPLYRVVERIQEEDEILLLTDLDTHGRKLYRYFYDELTRKGVRVNNGLRLLLFETPVRQIEGLWSFLSTWESA